MENYSTNFSGLHSETKNTNKLIAIDFMVPYNKKVRRKKAMHIAIMLVFVMNMTLASIVLPANPALACHGDISIIKKVVSNTPGSFNFSGTNNFSLDSNTQQSFNHVPGDQDYIVIEAESDGWELVNIECSGDLNGNTNINLANRSVTIGLDNNESIVCTFTNQTIVPQSECGNGIIESDEECDAGDSNGLLCEALYGESCTYCDENCELIDELGPYCGDTIINGDEECDSNSDENCSNNCELIEQNYCGDAIINNDETCDEGENNGLACVPEYGQNCNYCSETCTEITVNGSFCGDAIVNTQEECDDGLNNGNVCSATYGENCNYCDSECKVQEIFGESCGDGIINGAEECDGENGVSDNQACSENCSIVNLEHCGDAIVNENEECDLGTDNGLICDASYGETCSYCSKTCITTTIQGSYCGDGVINGNEECDYLNNIDTCAENCELIPEAYCGDGIINNGEECDGNNGLGNNQICTNECQINTLPYCGDGIVNGDEECDYANTENGDACSIDCQIETSPNEATCGNAILESGESCDDGDKNGQSGYCDLDCKSATVSGGGGGGFSASEKIIVLPISGNPYLDIAKNVAQKSAFSGDKNIEYSIIIANNGNLDAFNVIITDTLPRGLIFADDQSSSKTWKLGDMPMGDIESIKYLVDVLPDTEVGILSNTAIASADNHPQVSAEADLIIEKKLLINDIPSYQSQEILPVTGFSPHEMQILALFSLILFGAAIHLKKAI